MSLLGNIWVKLGLKSDDFNRGMDNAEKKTKTFGETMRGVAAKVTAAIAAFKMLAGTLKTITGFEASVSKLAAVLGTTADKLGRMTDSAIELGRKTQYTASEVVQLQTELAKLGFAEPDILAMQESVLKFAAAVGTDLPSAAARAGATMRGFGLTAEETTEMLNTMAVSTSKSALSFNYLDSTLGKLVPVTKAYGFDTRDTIALLGTLANAGIDASSAGTALRRVFAELANEDSKLNKALGKQPRTMQELVEGLQRLKDGGMGVKESFDLVGKYAGAAFAALVNGADDCRELYTELGNANGALDEMYETMTHNVQGAVKEVQSAWEGFILSLRGSTGILYTALANVRDLINELNYALFQSAKESTQTSIYYDKLSRAIAETGDKAGALDIAYRRLMADAQAKVSDLEGKSALGRLLNHDSLEEAKADVTGLTNAYKQLRGELNAPTKSAVPAPGGGGDEDDPFAKLLDSLNTKKTSEAKDGLSQLREEVREYAQDVKDASDYDAEMAAEAQRLLDAFHEQHPAIDTAKEDLISLANATAYAVEKTEDMKDKWAEACEAMGDALRRGVIDALDELAEALGTGNFDATKLLKALLNPMADTAISAGVMISGMGEAIEAFKASLSSLQGPVAIAAGAALIATGVAVKAGLAALASGNKGASAGATTPQYSYAGGYGVAIPQTTGAMELSGTVTVKGQDLQIALDNYNRNRGR